MKKKATKPAKSEMLPSRTARTTLTKGDTFQRSMNNYAKKTPSGAGAIGMPSIIAMARAYR